MDSLQQMIEDAERTIAMMKTAREHQPYEPTLEIALRLFEKRLTRLRHQMFSES